MRPHVSDIVRTMSEPGPRYISQFGSSSTDCGTSASAARNSAIRDDAFGLTS